MKERLAAADDLRTVDALTHAAYAHYVPTVGGKPLPMSEDYAPRIEAGDVWLLEEAGEALGLIVLEDEGDALMIFSVAIAPEHQHRGLGRRLIGFAEDEARRRGRGTLKLYTNAKMTRNIAIYRRAGFQETGRMENPAHPGRVRVDMEKTLDAAQRRSA